MKKILEHLKRDTLAYLLLIFGFLFRLFYIFTFTVPENYLFSDPGGYDARALQMAMGKFVMFSTYWPPFFHIFLSLIYRPIIFFGLTAFRIKIDVVIFAIFYMIGFWCIYKIAEKLFSKNVALIILLVLIFWYPLIFMNYLIMSENLFFPLLFLGLYILITKPLKPSTGLLLGLLWGFAFLSRPIFALAIPLFLLWGWRYKLNWKFLLNFTIVVALIIGSMMAFNFWYTGGAEKSISSNGGLGFALLWCDAKSIQFNAGGYAFGFASPSNVEYPDSTRIFTNIRFENQSYYYQMGLKCIEKNPKIIIYNLSYVLKIFNGHLFPTLTGAVAYWETLRLIFKILIIFFSATSLLTIVLIIFEKIKVQKDFKKYFYLIALLLISLPIMVYFQNIGEERYTIPYAPLLMILSVPFFTFSFNWFYNIFHKT